MTVYSKYEPVIGLEVHAQLLTNSKVFSSDSAAYGGVPNTHVSPITLGHPGTLPMVNKTVVEYAVKLGLACGCKISKENQFARKNYFYADLPKGYQITQDTTPICKGGYIKIKSKEGKEKKVNLTRIHIEEDAGKSIHNLDPFDSLIDLNRAGVPLLEIVSEPEIYSGEEAYQYLTEIRKLLRYLEICDGNMEEGSMRCDANISVKLKGETKLGKRVEVKNMNSIRNVQRAIDHEIKRQIDIIENNGYIEQQTRSFDAVNTATFALRSKEMANDYRYFPEPDLPPIVISDEYIDKIKAELPELPEELYLKYTKELNLSDYDAQILTSLKDIAMYFEEVIKHTNNYKAASNWVMGEIKSHLNNQAVRINEFPVQAENIAKLINLIEAGKVSNTIASRKLFPQMLKEHDKDPENIAYENNWLIESDSGSLELLIEQAIAKFPQKIEEYKAGKKGLIGLFMGEVMKLSQGKADPKKANRMLREVLER